MNTKLDRMVPDQLVPTILANGRMHGFVEFHSRDDSYVSQVHTSTSKWVKIWPDEEDFEVAGMKFQYESPWTGDQPGPNYRLANVWISSTGMSVFWGQPGNHWHLPCLDVDQPRSLLLENDIQVASPQRILLYHPEAISWVPSSTPDHWHVYIDWPIAWHDYEVMIRRLAERGVLEEGYAQASLNEGFTTVRKPECPKVPTMHDIIMADSWARPGEVYKDPYDED